MGAAAFPNIIRPQHKWISGDIFAALEVGTVLEGYHTKATDSPTDWRMARYAGGKTKKEKTADKRNRRLANREAKGSVQYVVLAICVIAVTIIALVWMSSRRVSGKDPIDITDPKQEEFVKLVKEKFEEILKEKAKEAEGSGAGPDTPEITKDTEHETWSPVQMGKVDDKDIEVSKRSKDEIMDGWASQQAAV